MSCWLLLVLVVVFCVVVGVNLEGSCQFEGAVLIAIAIAIAIVIVIVKVPKMFLTKSCQFTFSGNKA